MNMGVSVCECVWVCVSVCKYVCVYGWVCVRLCVKQRLECSCVRPSSRPQWLKPGLLKSGRVWCGVPLKYRSHSKLRKTWNVNINNISHKFECGAEQRVLEGLSNLDFDLRERNVNSRMFLFFGSAATTPLQIVISLKCEVPSDVFNFFYDLR